MNRRLLIFSLLISAVFCKNYSNYKVYDVTTSTRSQLETLLEWENHLKIDFWTHPSIKSPARIMIGPEVEQGFLQLLTKSLMNFELIIPDVEVMLEIEKQEHLKNRRNKRSIINKFSKVEDATFDHFWTFDEMESYAKLLAKTHPSIVKMEVIGESIENRNMFALKFSSNSSSFGGKPIIFIDAGTHAREWASHACAMYLIHQLATSEFSQEMLQKVDWVVVPNVNPDGYAYTHEKDRMWRKNRRHIDSVCTGVDLNRNYAHEWRDSSSAGCYANTYSGKSPLSEPETFAVAKLMKSVNHNLKLYVAFHSRYSSDPLLLWPWGFEDNNYVENWEEHQNLGNLFVKNVKSAGNKNEWIVGNSAETIYPANGNSHDFAKQYGKARLAFTVELPPGHAENRTGFEYPPDKIERLVKEVFMGYRALGKYIGQTYHTSNSENSASFLKPVSQIVITFTLIFHVKLFIYCF